MMIKLAATILAAALVLTPAVGSAHGQPPPSLHGGQVQEANENWVELIVAGNQVKLFVLDQTRQPVQSAQVSGTATVLVGGKPYKVDLVPQDANCLAGTLPITASGRTLATVSLTIAGKHLTARFSIES